MSTAPAVDDSFSLSDEELLQQPLEDEEVVAAKSARSKPHKSSASSGEKKKRSAKKLAEAPARVSATNIKNVNTAILKKIVETTDKREWDNNVKEFLKTYRFNINPATISTDLAVKLARNELEKPKRAAAKPSVDATANESAAE